MDTNFIDEIEQRGQTSLSPTALGFDDAFPAPEPRENQKEVIEHTVSGFDDGKDVVIVDAPPGFGKSLALGTIPRRMGASCFYVTPLNTLVDQLDDDEFMENMMIAMKGRNNYDCILPDAGSGVTVDKGKCQKESDFECPVKSECPYYERKDRAMVHPFVVTNMSYLMADSMIPDMAENTFGNRDVLIVDECQNIEDFAMSFISFTISKHTVPYNVWRAIDLPDDSKEDDLDYLLDWIRNEVLTECENERLRLERTPSLTDEQVDDKEQLQNFVMRVKNFLKDVENNDWICQIESIIKKNAPNDNKVVFKPIEVGRFLEDLLWSRADNIVLSSATVPKGKWLQEIGLGGKDVKRIQVPSPFPVENRKIVTAQAVGKMTYNEREDNAWPMAQKIKEIAEHHEGENGFVHCRSYSMAQMLRRAFTNHGEGKWFRDNVFLQDRSDREGSLEEWMNSDKPVFFSVNMAEGVSLDDDICRYQILAKTLYKHMGDKRTKFRVTERNEWDWYNGHAVIQMEQAYGRAVRSKDDHAVFYILDESAVGLMERSKHLFHDWFLEGVIDRGF